MRLLRNLLFIAGLFQLVLGVTDFAQAKDKDRDRDRKRTNSFTWNSEDFDSDRAWLGVEIRTLDEEFKGRDQVKADKGVYVDGVRDDSPAEKAGLMKGDVITKFNSTELTAADELIDLVSDSKAGDEVTLTLIRDGKTITQKVILGEWKDDNTFFFGRTRGGSDDVDFWTSDKEYGYIGVDLNTIDGQLATYFGMKDREGALVTEVEKDSPAEKAGLKAGDVILSVGDKQVESRSDVQKIVRRSDSEDTLALTVLRDKREMKVNVVPVEKELEFQGMFGNMPRMHRFDTAPMQQFRNMPGMRGLYRGDFDARDRDLDASDQSQRIRDLERDLDNLRREMENLRREIRKP